MLLRRLLSILFCSLFLLSSVSAETVFHDTSGGVIKASSLKNKWVIINYWASWCGYCIQEIPELNKFYKNNKDKDVVILGVNYDGVPMPDLKEEAQKANIGFPVLVEDPHSVWDLQMPDVLPVTFIISPKGKVVKTILGPNTEDGLLGILHDVQK